MDLVIAIVSYRVTDLTINCLRSLSGEIASVPGAQVIVCENGTGGDAQQRIADAIRAQGWQSWASLVAVHPNRGFTGGNNLILREVLSCSQPPRYVLLLNADTIVRPGALSALVEFMDGHPSVGIAGSRLEDPDGTPQRSAFRFSSFISEFETAVRFGPVSRLLQRWIVSPPVVDEACPTDWVAGASMIVRREVFTAIGMLDEDYYTYFDDIDFCRVARRAGWPCWYVPQSRVVHLVGQTTGITVLKRRPGRRPPYWFMARRHYFLKNHGRFYALLADAAWLAGLTLWKFRCFIQRRPDPDPPHLLLDAARHSVFVTGLKTEPVENPALGGSQAPVSAPTLSNVG